MPFTEVAVIIQSFPVNSVGDDVAHPSPGSSLFAANSGITFDTLYLNSN